MQIIILRINDHNLTRMNDIGDEIDVRATTVKGEEIDIGLLKQ